MPANPECSLTALGLALSQLQEQLVEASHAYEACLARYAAEKENPEGEYEWQCDAVDGTEARLMDRRPELLDAAAAFKARADDHLPPASLPAPARTAFFVAPALPAPTGDACPHTPQRAKSWTKVVRLEAEHGAVDNGVNATQCVVSSETECEAGIAGSERTIAHRLLSRLGKRSTTALVTGRDLHQAVAAMGLERYSLKDMEHLLLKISVVIKLEFRQPDKQGVGSPLPHRRHPTFPSEVATTLSERANWTWPDVCMDASWHKASTTFLQASQDAFPTDPQTVCIPAKALIKAVMEPEVVLKKLFGSKHCEQLLAIREVLATGDANRLVSELTCVRIDDLATRTPEPEVSKMELLLGFMLTANGVMVGVQADEHLDDWAGWLWLQVGFTSFFLLDILVRQCRYGLRTFFCGPQYAWNLFDALLVVVGVVECITWGIDGSGVSYAAMLRFIRLLKLMRLVRVFRLRFMWELQLMIKGFFGGVRTLCWAFVLLFFVVYILGVVAYTWFADDPDQNIHAVFDSVPRAMFTCFRCITGECVTHVGGSIPQSLLDRHGLKFGVSFFLAYITIMFGVFNVILAIYVETTMEAAKLTEDANKGSKERESIRVAHITKRLLKLFCAAERSFNGAGNGDRRHSLDMKLVLTSSCLDSTEVEQSTSICKELFLMMIQEPEVQKLMDELDIPPDRANLFDSIDADGSGNLEATELVRGLLKVRGEVKKSDQVACILALRSVQSMLREMDAGLQESRRMLEQLSGGGAPIGPTASDEPSKRPGAQ